MYRLKELRTVITTALAKRGLDIVHPCNVRAYNVSEKVLANPSVRLPGGGEDGNEGIGFIVGNSRVFWPIFVRELRASRLQHKERAARQCEADERALPGSDDFVLALSPNPIEEFVADAVCKLLQSPPLDKEKSVVRYAHITDEGLLYGTTFV